MSTNPEHGLAAREQQFESHTLPVTILLFICFWAFFYNAGLIEIDSMEARNLVTAREMLLYDNWLLPTMNGEIRLAKPPLPTWFAALVSASAGGSNDLTLLRLPNAAAALLLVLFTYGLAWTLCKDRTLAFMAAALLATNFLMMKVGQRATWDIFCHSFMLAALWAFVDGIRNDRRWPVFALAGVMMALSFMSKGPVSFFALLLPFTIAWLWIFRGGGLAAKWPLLAMAFLLCIVISSLWPLYIMNYHPEALLDTAGTESRAWISRHVKEIGYYLEFPVFSGLWLVVTLAAMIKPFAEKRVTAVREYRFFLLWLAVDIVLLSALPEKKTRYLLPAMIPMALLAAMLFRGWLARYGEGTERPWDRRLMVTHLCWLTLLGAALPAVLLYRLHEAQVDTGPLLAALLAATALLLIGGAWYLLRTRRLFDLFLLTALQFCVIAFVYMNYYREIGIDNPEFKSMAAFDASRLPADVDIFLTDNREGTKYVWDLRRRIRSWQLEEVRPILENGGSVAVISTADPAQEMAELYSRPVEIRVIDSFDYNENRPQRTRTYLYLVRARQ